MTNDAINHESKLLQEGQAALPPCIDEIDILLINVRDKVRKVMYGKPQEVRNILADFNINLDFLRVQLSHAIQSLKDKQKQESSESLIIKGDQ